MRFNRLKLCFACIVTFSVIAGVHLANADEFDELLRYVPGDANALVMINLLSIRNSSESKDADPSQQFAKHFDHLPDNFPTTASKMVLAAEFDLETMEAKWEIAVAKFEHESPFDFFPDAKDSAAGIEIILDRPCCLIDGVQFVQLSNHTVGLIWPAQRQQVSRWIRG